MAFNDFLLWGRHYCFLIRILFSTTERRGPQQRRIANLTICFFFSTWAGTDPDRDASKQISQIDPRLRPQARGSLLSGERWRARVWRAYGIDYGIFNGLLAAAKTGGVFANKKMCNYVWLIIQYNLTPSTKEFLNCTDFMLHGDFISHGDSVALIG